MVSSKITGQRHGRGCTVKKSVSKITHQGKSIYIYCTKITGKTGKQTEKLEMK